MNVLRLPTRSWTQLLVLSAVTSLVLSGLLVRSVQAQEAQTLQVGNVAEIVQSGLTLTAIPPRLGDDDTLIGVPGKTLQTSVRVRNNTSQPLMVRTLVEDFIIGEDGSTPIPLSGDNDSRWSLSRWVQVVNPENSIAPHGSSTITLLIAVPEDALPGGRYAMVLSQPQLGSSQGGGSGTTAAASKVSQRVGTLLYVRVPGDIREEAALRSLRVPFFSEYGPVPVRFSVESLADIHLRTQGTVTIKGMFGRTLATIPVQVQNIFPYTQREFGAQWERVWSFGRFTAEVAMQYGSQGNVVMASTTFWVVPLRLILLIMLGIAVILVLWRWWRSRHQRQTQETLDHIHLLEDRIHQLESQREGPPNVRR